MSLPNGSASAVERIIACPSSLVLARVNRTSEYAERGHGLHAYVRAVLTGTPPDTALAALDEEHRETARGIEWSRLVGDLSDVRCEVAYAIDVRARTARLLGYNVGRDYAAAALRAGAPLGEWEIPGSLDLEGVSAVDDHPVVVDTKTGYQDVTPAAENGQGLFFAAVKMLMLGVAEVEFRIAKIKPSGRVWLDVARFGAWDVDAFLDEVEAALVRAKDLAATLAAGGALDVTEGGHCQYCPGADHCPAKTRLARAMLGELASVEHGIDALSLDAAGRAWELAHDRIAPLLDRVLKALKERAKREPLPLPSSGQQARAVEYVKETLVGADAVALARSLGATPEQIADCYRSATVVQIRAVNAPGAKRAKKGRAA